MIAVPAVDVRDGACVQLVGGEYSDERVRIEDPLAVARRWVECGFRRLHVVDLDAATQRGENASLIRDLVANTTVPVCLGGGVRTSEQVRDWLGLGADSVVAGTRVAEDRDWISEVCSRHPGRLTVAADVRGRQVVTRGWTHDTGRDLVEFLISLDGFPLAGVLVTAVHREGRQAGPDLDLLRLVLAHTRLPVIASGGIASMRDLEQIQEMGVAQAVLGMALYSGALDPGAVAREYRE